MDSDARQAVSNELHRYMQFRATNEGLGFDLSLEWFDEGLARGVREFFGVVVDDYGIIVDTQAPTIWRKWISRGGGLQ